MSSKPNAALQVLPAGTLPVQKLEGDAFKLKVARVATEKLEIPEVEVIYPDGFIKWHQTTGIDDLLAKVKGTLFGRFGITDYTVDSAPAGVEVGEIEISDVTFKD